MKSVFENCSEAERAIESVLKILENMFFSMPIPEEIMNKYNYLKDVKYKRAGLHFTPITKTHYPSIGSTPQSDPNKLQEFEDSFMNLYNNQLLIFDSILNCTTERGNTLIEMIKNPLRVGYFTKHGNDYSTIINELKNRYMKALNEYEQKRSILHTNQSQTLRITELSPDAFSQGIYKIELSQNKILTIFDTIEDAINQYSASIKSLKAEISSINESNAIRERQLIAKTESLHQQVTRLENEIRNIETRAARQCDDLAKQLHNEYNQEINKLRGLHEKEIEILENEHLADKKIWEKKLVQVRNEGQKSDELCDYVGRLEEVIRAIRERLKAYYDYQRPLESTWKDEFANTEIQEILYTEFVIFSANKHAADNKRLIEQLAECNRELEELRDKLDKAIMPPNPNFFKEVTLNTKYNSWLQK